MPQARTMAGSEYCLQLHELPVGICLTASILDLPLHRNIPVALALFGSSGYLPLSLVATFAFKLIQNITRR